MTLFHRSSSGSSWSANIIVVDPDLDDYLHLLQFRDVRDRELTWHLFGSGRAVLRTLFAVSGLSMVAGMCLINVSLPDMAGSDLWQMMQPRLLDATGVLIGSEYRIEDELTARNCGAAMYVCKPLHKAWFERIEIRPPVSAASHRKPLAGGAAFGSAVKAPQQQWNCDDLT